MTSREGVYEFLASYRAGDMWASKIEQTETPKTELEYFLACIESNQTPFNAAWLACELSSCWKHLQNH